MAEDKGLRYNEGKLRFDLIPAFAQQQYAEVLTKGSVKYAERNWELGMKWSKVLSSLERHLEAIKRGEDYDPETGLLHSAHVMCNAAFLTEYYKIHPQGDDRPHKFLKPKKIGLDIDDVLSEWVTPFTELAGVPIPTSWYFGFPQHHARLVENGLDYNNFMRNLPVKTKPEDIPFEPTAYITNRSNPDVPVEIAQEWIAKNGFPQVKVIQTIDKVTAAKELNLDIFVDDKFETFMQMNQAGILCYLFDAPHNRKHNVGYKRIKSLKELA